MLKLDLLEINDVINNEKIQLFNRSIKAKISDYALLTGIDIPDMYSRTLDTRYLEGKYWIKTSICDKEGSVINNNGRISWDFNHKNNIGLRLKMSYQDAKDYIENEEVIDDRFSKVRLGKLPRRCLSFEEVYRLEKLLSSFNLQLTGNSYTVNDLPIIEKGFKERKQIEYTDTLKKYVKIEANTKNKGIILPNGLELIDGNYYWVEVEPITWIVDKEKDLMVTEEIILSGIPYDFEFSYSNSYKDTFINHFLNNILNKEIFRDISKKELNKPKVYIKTKN